MKIQPWLHTIKEEDLPTDELQLMAQACGMDTVITALSELSGLTIRIPTKGIVKLRNEYIKKQCDGTKSSIIKLAREFELDQRYIRQILTKEN